jgi:MFS family permease
MQRLAAIAVFFTALFGILLSPTLAQASGGGDETPTKFSWKDSGATRTADLFVQAVANGDYTAAYEMGGEVLREKRTLEEFTADMQRWGFDKPGSVEWDNGNNALPANNGFKLMGTYSPQSGDAFPVYLHLEGDAHVGPYERDRSWSAATKWTVMDYRSGQSMFSRLLDSGATPLDWFLAVCTLGLLIAFICLVVYYIYGLRGHPRELWLMYFTKLTEYSAYGAAASIMVLFLQQDVLLNGSPLGDSPGYMYYMVWGLVATIITMMVGAVCDTIGVKKCLLIGAVMLLISRFCMPLSQNIVFVTFFGFLPLAFGFAITGPVLKVGIKWFTTLKTATLGFGLFYTLMNVGFWVGAELADYFRKNHADGIEIWGFDLTTYQAIIFIGFFINIPDFIAILLMRDGAEMTEKGLVIRKQVGDDQATVTAKLKASVGERRSKMTSEFLRSLLATAIVGALAYALVELRVHEWSIGVIKAGSYVWAFVVTAGLIAVGGLLYATLSHLGAASAGAAFDRVMKSVRDATEGTIEQLKENSQARSFWIYMAMLGILVFVRLTFYVFHVMFPTYAIRVFGDDFPVASIFGSLNPAMIIFLVPLISVLTVNVRSYTMLILGTVVSAGSVFLCFMPDSIALAIGDTWLGTWIFDYWLEAPVGNQDPFLVSLVVFIIVFTVGEALWSPRLMQFSAEIAPRGKEGAYISLAILPYFFGKIGAIVMADMLTAQYFSQEMVEFPDHRAAWFWIGSMAMISPIGMIIWRKTFNQSEQMAEDEAKAQVAAEEAEAASEEQGA